MKTLIISDVHANLPALEAVLEDAGRFSRVWCLGDLVGYGPYPNECVERIIELPGIVCIKGNHDAALLGEIETRNFNDEARQSLFWLKSEIKERNFNWLSGLRERVILEGVTLVHGSPRNPIWEYIFGEVIANENMSYFNTQICLVGHTHVPCICSIEGDDLQSTEFKRIEARVSFRITQKCILNPGSVGQPRDRDPRAAYLIYDDEDETWTLRRVGYDINRVQKRILAAGLPRIHAYRLELGK